MNPEDMLRIAAVEEEERQKNLLIPIAVATGAGGAALGSGVDSIINRIRRMRGNPKTSIGGRFAASAIMGLAGAIGADQMPNREAKLLAKLQMGDTLSQDEVDLIRSIAETQATRGLV